MKKLSIIIAVYNIEKYLDKCLNSVISQKGNDIEILIVDDGSVDNSLNICKKYQKKDKRIVIIHQENSGLSSSRNTGIENAKGEYLWFIDGDDYISNGSVNIIRKYLDKYDIIYFNYNKIDEKNIVKVTYEKEYDNLYDKYILGYTAVWNKVFHRKMFSKDRFPLKCSYNDIYIIPSLIYKKPRIIFIKDILYNYVYRKNSLSNTRKFNLQDYLMCLENVYNKTKDISPLSAECFYINQLLIYMYAKEIRYGIKFDYKNANKILKEKFPKYYKNKYYNDSVFKKIYIRMVYFDVTIFVKLFTFLKLKVYNKIISKKDR